MLHIYKNIRIRWRNGDNGRLPELITPYSERQNFDVPKRYAWPGMMLSIQWISSKFTTAGVTLKNAALTFRPWACTSFVSFSRFRVFSSNLRHCIWKPVLLRKPHHRQANKSTVSELEVRAEYPESQCPVDIPFPSFRIWCGITAKIPAQHREMEHSVLIAFSNDRLYS